MEFIDTHTHCTDEAFAGCEEEIISRALECGVGIMLQADVSSLEREPMYALCRKHPDCLKPMLGLYPGSVDKDWQEEIDKMLPYLKENPVAVGEIGLDYHFSTEFKEEQKDALRFQLELAAKWDLPVNIHLRDATADFLDILESCRGLGLRGNMHAYSGSIETFRRLLRLGDWSIGVGGVVTFKNALLPEVVKEVPIECILLETDAPYLAPVPLRGSRNESSNIPVIARKVAEIKGLGIEDVALHTTRNAKRLFKI